MPLSPATTPRRRIGHAVILSGSPNCVSTLQYATNQLSNRHVNIGLTITSGMIFVRRGGIVKDARDLLRG